METKIDEIVKNICSNVKIESVKGEKELERILPHLNALERRQLGENFLELLEDPQSSSGVKYGALLGSKLLVLYLNLEDDADCNFILSLRQICVKLLPDMEDRMRFTAGEVLGCLCEKVGVEIYIETKDSIFKLIESRLERNIADNDSYKLQLIETEKLLAKLAGSHGSEKRGIDVAQVLQDSIDSIVWKNLDSCLKALQLMVEACGSDFEPFVDEELVSLIFKTLAHPHRFVRISGFFLCASLVGCGYMNNEPETENVPGVTPMFAFGREFCKYLAEGLADDWPYIRLPASVAARNLVFLSPKNESGEFIYPELLPRICLNRFYAADGVKVYSQEAWNRIIGTAGTEILDQHIELIVEYYEQATLSEDHAIKEAACACIGELGSIVSKECVKPYINTLLNTLLRCFQDDSWLVRDAACVACGNFVLCFPNESSVAMKTLYPMFYRNLSYPNSSARQGAAYALAKVVRSYGESALENVLSHMVQCLENIKKQPEELEKYSDRSIVTGSLFSRIEDSQMELNLDVNREKESQPWEAADGCVHLIGALSQITEIHNEITRLVPLMKEAGRYRHYAYHVIFLQTICKQIPVLARNLGKKVFKGIAEEFFDIVFYSLECDNSSTSRLASQCLSFMVTFLGPNILRTKVRKHNPNYEKSLESVIHSAPL